MTAASGSVVRRWTRNLSIVAGLVVVACSEQASSGLGGSGRARLNLVPRFSLVEGGPSIQLSRLDAWMIRPVQDSLFQTAPFDNGAATLGFDMKVDGESEDVILDLTGFDTKGVAVYHARQPYTITQGDNNDLPQPEFTYTAPDAAVTTVVISPRAPSVDAGATTTLTVAGFTANQQTISPLNVGWTARNTNIATIDANTGVVTGVARGQTYVVARTATNKADSVLVAVTGFGVTPDKVEKLPNGTQQFSVTAARGTVSWTVNGVTGGNATFGTITSAGFYTAPAKVPDPATFNVCVVQASPAANACSSVTIATIPTSGADVVVFNDINSFDDGAGSDSNNVKLFRNLVNYTGPGVRPLQKGVLLTCGHQSITCATGSIFLSTVQALGYTMTTTTDSVLPLPIPSNVKLLILSLPKLAYSIDEINAMKQFSVEGGRILYIGEYGGYLGAVGVATENDFFTKMGAVMRNGGQDIDCGIQQVTAEHLRPHQVMTGLTGLTMGCASEVILGPNDYPLYLSQDGLHVLAAVAKVDVTPLPPQAAPNRIPASPKLNRAATKGAPTAMDPLGRDLIKPRP